MIDIAAIKSRFEALEPFLTERDRRLFAAGEARAAGRGGIAAVSVATGIARSTIGRGLVDLRLGTTPFGARVRRSGGGSKPATEIQPGLLDALNTLVESSIRGDPEAPLRWVSKSQRHLSAALAERGFTAGQKLVGRLLKKLGFSLQANSKTREGTNHPDRNAQFDHISAQVKAFQAAGEPAISVDTKKKELVGDFKNGGRELRPKGQPEPVRVHDFMIPELGKAVPYGVYDIAANTGWINLGINHDTAVFAVESIRRWWYELGASRYPAASKLLINADCGGSNGVRVRLWKRELQVLADELGIAISVCHLPPGTSKWNRVEHKLFAFITQNWRGKPLVSHEVIVQLIASTTTKTGLSIACRIDRGDYEKGIKITNAEMASLNIQHADFHGEWNYTIRPRKAKL
ncbi:ISAzo13 family transposase [Acidiphilium iwatense]|uniref:ISAzo13 family transposase n=1 Tax=Acidiphilium iwatense TaxID=768198 RepID=A0ABS9E1G2_9PROT|nr:ISAzo13 family transposase [Acidiphilium iwatense]MCF3948848.1 ISAzo13 family transposase [Acidiphilium iwatense]